MTSTELSTRDDAVARSERIRAGIRSLAELQQDITDAYHARDWATLGYDTWDSYVTGEFGGTLPRLDRQERRELTVNLRAEGLSTRAIASAAGADDKTVRNDLRDAGAECSAPADDVPIIGQDGKTYNIRGEHGPEIDVPPDQWTRAPNSKDAADQLNPTPERAPRTDVVATVNRAISRANDAADSADKITAEHLKNRTDEIAAWHRNLARHAQSLQRLLNLMEEHQA